MAPAAEHPTLSVIVITKNEEQRIERCLTAVMESVKSIPQTEIFLVDSGSTDRTLHIATEFQIRIIQLKKPALASASAGRYVGSIYSRGEFIQFVDADCVLDPLWVSRGLELLRSHPEIAGVRGIISQPDYRNPLARMNLRAVSSYEKSGEGETTEGAVSGLILLRREALERAGNFNPFLRSEEEGELNERMVKANARFWYLRVPMATDYGYSAYRRGDVYRKMMRYKTGYGQILRLGFHRSPTVSAKARLVFVAVRGLATVLAEAIGIILFLLYRSLLLLEVDTFLGGALLFFKTAQRQSIKSALVYLRDLHIEWPWIVKGFLLPVRYPEQYPRDVTWVKR